MAREFRIDHDKLNDSNTVTQEMDRAFKEQGLRKHVNITTSVEDDPHLKQRVVKVRNTQIFDMGRGKK